MLFYLSGIPGSSRKLKGKDGISYPDMRSMLFRSRSPVQLKQCLTAMEMFRSENMGKASAGRIKK